MSCRDCMCAWLENSFVFTCPCDRSCVVAMDADRLLAISGACQAPPPPRKRGRYKTPKKREKMQIRLVRKTADNRPEKVSKRCGSGRWKQRTSDEVRRVAFACPAMTSRSVARTLKPPASHGYVGKVLHSCAGLVEGKQRDGIGSTMQALVSFLAFQLIMTKHNSICCVRGRLLSWHVLKTYLCLRVTGGCCGVKQL